MTRWAEAKAELETSNSVWEESARLFLRGSHAQ